MRHLAARAMVGLLALAAGLWLMLPAGEAVSKTAGEPVAATYGKLITCPPGNLVADVDAGTVTPVSITCGTGFTDVMIEAMPDAGVVLVCPKTGATFSNWRQMCSPRGLGSAYGYQYTLNGKYASLGCLSGEADAGAIARIHCGL